MNAYLPLVSDYARLFRDGRALPLGGQAAPPRPAPSPDAPRALIFSPHPDDECIVGALALRLRRESGWEVVNVAVTQGSAKARQAERLVELRAACGFMGFGLVTTGPCGLEKVTAKCRSEEPATWAPMVRRIADILQEHRPRAIFLPHEHDWNGTHVGTHLLVMDALAVLGPGFQTHLVETEYWGQMTRPNLMVEADIALVADMVAGVSFHAGEVRRNPFHLLLPAWMQDNVRRGGELVGGQGGAAPDFGFATLYRRRLWRNGAVEEIRSGGRILPASARAEELFGDTGD